jgi:hypothetical protein
MEKKKRDDLKMLFRNKLRQKQDLEEKHAFELKANPYACCSPLHIVFHYGKHTQRMLECGHDNDHTD